MKLKTPERKLQLLWEVSHDKEVGKVVNAIICLIMK